MNLQHNSQCNETMMLCFSLSSLYLKTYLLENKTILNTMTFLNKKNQTNNLVYTSIHITCADPALNTTPSTAIFHKPSSTVLIFCLHSEVECVTASLAVTLWCCRALQCLFLKSLAGHSISSSFQIRSYRAAYLWGSRAHCGSSTRSACTCERNV